jgi:APA family basic amino acid/polyamine antiporter
MRSDQKALGFWMLTSLVAGNIIGSGIFLLPSSLAEYGSIGMVGWMITTLGALCFALVFAKLGHLQPQLGGPYAYCKEAFGDFIGFSVAYNHWLSMWLGNTAIVVVLVGYLTFFFSALHHPFWFFLTCTTIIWTFTIINILGIRQAGIVQLITTVLKLIPLIGIICIGVFFVHPSYLTNFNISGQSTFSALSVAIALTFWSFLGIESATIPAEDVEKPKKNIPSATIIGTLIAAFIYILSATIVMSVIPMHALVKSNAPFADAAHMMLGQWGGLVVAIGAIISAMGTLNGWILMQGQVPLAAARDHLFPKFFAKISKRNTPVVGLIFSSSLMTILLALNCHANLVSQFTLIISLAVLAALIPYIYTSMAVILILIRHKKLSSDIKIGRSIVVSILAFLYIIWILLGSDVKSVFYGTFVLFSCIPIYVWIKWKQTK